MKLFTINIEKAEILKDWKNAIIFTRKKRTKPILNLIILSPDCHLPNILLKQYKSLKVDSNYRSHPINKPGNRGNN